MKRVALIFGILALLLDLGYDGFPGKVSFTFQACPYEMGVSGDTGQKDGTCSGNEVVLHHSSRSSSRGELHPPLTSLAASNLSETIATPAAWLDTLPAIALRIIDLRYSGGSGTIPLLL